MGSNRNTRKKYIGLGIGMGMKKKIIKIIIKLGIMGIIKLMEIAIIISIRNNNIFLFQMIPL